MCNRKFELLRIIFLSPLAVIYRFVVGFRNFLYDNQIIKSKQYDIPVISIGNLSVGGTGKTPHTEYVVNLLKDNYKVAVLSRGYKRKTKGFRLVEQADDYTLCGDEALQVKQKFNDIVVAVCESRAKGIERLLELYPDLGVIILDDAYQHRKVKPGLHILLNNYNFPIAKDYVLPLGRLREPRHNVNRAHLVIYTNCSPNITPIERRILIKESNLFPFQYLFFSKVVYKQPKLLTENVITPLENFKNYNVLAVTGIAHPEKFVQTITDNCKYIKHLRYSDHHNFTISDFKIIEKNYNSLPEPRVIFVTEKDAVRLRTNTNISNDIKSNIYYIDIEIELICNVEEKQQFNNQIISYVKNNKRYNKLYKNAF